MRLKFFVLAMGLLPWTLWGQANPCQNIQFQTIEAIAPQGFLGTLTPDPDPDMTVDIAYRREIEVAWKGVTGLRRQPGIGYQAPQAGRMKLYELCQRAQQERIRQINIICSGDTGTTNSWSSSTRKTTQVGYVSGECFLSSWTGDIEDMEEHRRHQIGRSFSSKETRFPASARRNRYDALSNMVFRTNIYSNLIYQAVNSGVAQFRPPRRSSETTDSDITVSPHCAPPAPDPFEDINRGFGQGVPTMKDEHWDQLYGEDFWQRTWGYTEWRVNGRLLHRR